ncbi:GNAT family N-acetyltransferase [Oceanobacillus salinisoli]|uniref:GNAT family N-acetyltransferase n=1 Tax=Oceanobacillus salinisoli TaxID=2678611 RepID=UPI0018CC0C01|nr:GNAT family N-acetyltransferase [Oceanobacillus salinisoli]
MIRLATSKDLNTIATTAEKTVKVMKAEGSDQWDETYPTIHHFSEDIKHSSLFIYEVDSIIYGFITAVQNIAKEYNNLNWSLSNDEVGTFHRLIVDPERRKTNVASELIKFVEGHFQKLGLRGMKIDTYSINEKAQRLFTRLGYEKVGEYYMEERELPFLGYEKEL